MVASAVGGLRTLVVPGVTGMLVESRDPESFAAAIASVLTDPVRAAAMGAAAAEESRRYSWSTTAARLRRLYADLSVRTPVACA